MKSLLIFLLSLCIIQGVWATTLSLGLSNPGYLLNDQPYSDVNTSVCENTQWDNVFICLNYNSYTKNFYLGGILYTENIFIQISPIMTNYNGINAYQLGFPFTKNFYSYVSSGEIGLMYRWIF